MLHAYHTKKIIILIEFMAKNTLVQWKVGNELRQGGITSGFLFNFYFNAVLTDIAALSLGYDLKGYK